MHGIIYVRYWFIKQKVILKLSACVPNIYSYGCYIVKTGSNSIINLKSLNHAFITWLLFVHVIRTIQTCITKYQYFTHINTIHLLPPYFWFYWLKSVKIKKKDKRKPKQLTSSNRIYGNVVSRNSKSITEQLKLFPDCQQNTHSINNKQFNIIC